MAAVDTRIVFAGRRVCGNCFSHSGSAVVGIDLSLVVDRHDDLVCVGEFWLDVVMVRRGNRDGRHDNLHVRALREETQRGIACRRGLEGVGTLKPSTDYTDDLNESA